jgi:type IV pilus assembly protein PilC
VLGNSLKTLALARLAWTLSVTLNTGMDTIRAVTMALKNSQNVIFTSGMETVASVLRRGNTISEAFRAAGGYPAEFLDVMEVGEQTGEVSESMERLSKLYEDRAKAALSALTVLAGFLIWGLVAAFIIVLIFRVFSIYIGQINSLLP